MKQWLPEEIADFQKRHGLMMKEMAEMLGVRREHVYQLKMGTRIPSDTIRRLLDCLDRSKISETGKEKTHGKAQGNIPTG